MSIWTSIKALLGMGGTVAGGVATGGVLPTVQAGAELGHAGLDTYREGKRDNTAAALKKEKDQNSDAIAQAIKKATQNGAALLLCFMLFGCATPPSRDDSPSTGNVKRLLKRPDFEAAAKASPLWVEDAMDTVNTLEYELQSEKARSREVH